MDNDQNGQMLENLLARKRKLLEIRGGIKSKLEINEEDEKNKADGSSPNIKKQKYISLLSPKTHLISEPDKKDSNPNTPYSDQPSVSPPSFSPHSPYLRGMDKLQATLKGKPHTPMQDKMRSISPPLGTSFSKRNVNNCDPKSSPIQPMSPETEEIFNVLTQPEQNGEQSGDCNSEVDVECYSDIIEDSEISELNDKSFYEDSDDSVRDPNYIRENIEVSETESDDDDASENESDEPEKLQELILEQINQDQKGSKNFTPFKEKEKKCFGNLTFANKPLLFSTTTEMTNNLTSDPIDATMNGKENRNAMLDMDIENETSKASLMSKKDEEKEIEGMSEIEKDHVGENEIIEVEKSQEIISNKNNFDYNGSQSLIPTEEKDDKSLEEKINTNKKQEFATVTAIDRTDNKTMEEKENRREIPYISTEDDSTNASLMSEKDEGEENNKAQDLSGTKSEELKVTSIENFTSTQDNNTNATTTTHETKARSMTPINYAEDNLVDESVARTSYDTGAQGLILENETRGKEYERIKPTINKISTQSFGNEVNTEEDVRNEDENSAETLEVANTSKTEKKRKGRSRKQKEESKILRNTGKSYVMANGKVVPERQQEDLRNCRLKCDERFTVAERKQCFESYWKLGTRDRRAIFVSKSVTILPKKSQSTDVHTKERNCYCIYKIFISGEEKPVCKECFCRLLGETKAFVNIIIEKKKNSPTGLIDTDARGIQPPSNKKTVEELSEAINHISSFPSYESHYCRKRTGKKYLAADLSIIKMYREYKKTTPNPISLKLYSKCFHDLNLSFKQPSKDTCNTCDVLNAKIKTADGDYKIQLTAELNEHQSLAEKAYDEKRTDKDIVKTDSSVRAFTFDLQQCLPTPYLKTSVSFYKRQLWSFNLTIHDLANNEATCYMWDETVGARGANQIASCLWHFCNNLPPEVKEVIFYSDTCGGQNKNNIVAMMFMHLLNNHPNLQTINHKFLVSGHTHMECDSDHAIIEKTKKRTQMKINHLNDWVQLVRTCKIKNYFKVVVVMTLEDFLDFSELKSKKGPFSIKKQDDSGGKFLWQPIKWLQYKKTDYAKIQYKHSLDRDAPFKSVTLKKRGKVAMDSFALNPISREPLPISTEKKKDLMDLLELIDVAFRDFYLQIKTTNRQPTDPDLDEDNPDSDD